MNKWKETCRNKQLAFKNKFGLKKSGSFSLKNEIHSKESILHHDDALEGANFYCYQDKKEWENLKAWATQSKAKGINFLSNNMKNMLRSEHIPYNVFYPLEKLRFAKDESLNKLLSSISGVPVDEISLIRIEYSGEKNKAFYLDDNTSFDAYILLKSGGDKIGLGIEVKYTEESYPYGKTEKENLFRPGSLYMQVAENSKYFKDFNSKELKSKELKQPFRNHLLGMKMCMEKEIDKFISVHFYPKGNTYQTKVVKAYKEELREEFQASFIELRFEDFVAQAKAAGISGQWLNYFEERYL